MPSMSGSFGRLRKPTAVMTPFARSTRSPSGPSMDTCHSLVVLVPRHRPHLGLEDDVVAQLERVRDPVEVALVLGRRAVRVRVAVVDAEEVRVGATLRVDTTSGIPVLEPRTADVGVLLDDGEGDAGALQLDRGVEAAQPAADDDDVERFEPVLRRRRLPLKARGPTGPATALRGRGPCLRRRARSCSQAEGSSEDAPRGRSRSRPLPRRGMPSGTRLPSAAAARRRRRRRRAAVAGSTAFSRARRPLRRP